ncbi:hypothetical protein KGF57_003971 [Candida theae]|uniref:Major facilitator superfamily (MFS) profile domain-containing protein n=1 Tax=Candida theae TaxID=1198502 RepID=A0AAD5FXD7_9ASCO|nr:uncharacterized protein KGF57_003971 [Candida theae]KAI5953762.1 hypothetical protein KGF57_003971 [Candida theae]
MVIVGLLRLSEPIAFASYLSYIFFMIKSFRIAKSDADVSRYSGYLASAFAFSQFLSSVKWGKASDKYGRKPIILFGCFGTAISMIVFGFSTNFYMACAARIMMGLLNGNVSIMRTTVGEIAVEKRHQGIAFSNLSLLWSLGKCVGAYLAGKLTDVDHFRNYRRDEEESKHESDSLFVRFPFAFSNIVISSIILCFIVLGWLFLEETNERVNHKRDRGLEIGDSIRRLLGFEVPDRPWKMAKSEDGEFLIEENSLRDDDLEENDTYELRSLTSNEEVTTKKNTDIALFTWPIIYRIICNFLLSFCNIIYTEFLPILLSKSIDAKSLKFPIHSRGGFGYSTEAVGKLLSVTGLTGVICVSLLFPVINKYLSLLTAFRSGLGFIPLISFTLPLIIFTIPEYNPLFHSHAQTTALLYLNTFLSSFVGSISFSQMTLLIHRASPKQHRAVINGYTISFTAFARFLSPLIWGWIMSLCDSHGIGVVAWWMLGAIYLVVFFFTFLLSEDDEPEI